MKRTIISILFIITMVALASFLGILTAEYIHSITMQEIKAFHKFVDDPRNEGQYIMDFETGICYDIDGKNPDVPPLTIKEMDIKNIRNRIMGNKSIHCEIADWLFDVIIKWRNITHR